MGFWTRRKWAEHANLLFSPLDWVQGDHLPQDPDTGISLLWWSVTGNWAEVSPSFLSPSFLNRFCQGVSSHCVEKWVRTLDSTRVMPWGLQISPNLPWEADFPLAKVQSQQPHITKLGVWSNAPGGITCVNVCTVHLYHAHTIYPGLNNAAFTLAMCEAPHSVHSSHCIFYFFPGGKISQPGYDPLNWFHDPLTGHNLQVEQYWSSLLCFTKGQRNALTFQSNTSSQQPASSCTLTLTASPAPHRSMVCRKPRSIIMDVGLK